MFIFCFAFDCMLVQIWVQLNLVCHRIYSKSTIFVVFLLMNHIVIFFCLW